MNALWVWLRTGMNLQQIRDEAYIAGYRQALADARTTAAAERVDRAAGTHQPYPNE